MTAALLVAVLAAPALPAVWRLRRARRDRALHELRGGLCVARLLAEGGDPDRAGLLAALGRAERAADLLAGAAGRERAHEPAPVRSALEGLAAGWRALAELHGASIVVECTAGAAGTCASAAALTHAAGNLVANAIEHGGGRVRVQIRERGHDRVAIVVGDGGPGPGPRRRLRPPRHGRGHGLRIAERAARAAGGRLLPGPGGATVLELPVTGVRP